MSNTVFDSTLQAVFVVPSEAEWIAGTNAAIRQLVEKEDDLELKEREVANRLAVGRDKLGKTHEEIAALTINPRTKQPYHRSWVTRMLAYRDSNFSEELSLAGLSKRHREDAKDRDECSSKNIDDQTDQTDEADEADLDADGWPESEPAPAPKAKTSAPAPRAKATISKPEESFLAALDDLKRAYAQLDSKVQEKALRQVNEWLDECHAVPNCKVGGTVKLNGQKVKVDPKLAEVIAKADAKARPQQQEFSMEEVLVQRAALDAAGPVEPVVAEPAAPAVPADLDVTKTCHRATA